MTVGRTIQSLGLCLSLAGPAAAQSRAAIAGQVIDRASGRPLRAEITLANTSRSVTTDSAGRYAFPGLPTGLHTFHVRALGFSATTFSLELAPGRPLVHSVALDSIAAAQPLPAVDVSANAPAASYRLTAFERRRQTGRGQYLTEGEIRRTGASTIAEAVRGLRGILFECGGGGGCYVRMSRAPMRCLPEYIVDDHVMNDFGPKTPIGDVVAMEVYGGPGDVAGEFAGRNAGCGVIVIHTRSGPPRRPPG